MPSEPITPERVDELTAFLQLFDLPGFEPTVAWSSQGASADAGQRYGLPYPTYEPSVERFFALAGQPCWTDYAYLPNLAAELVGDDAIIAAAFLPQIKTMLTWCVRGERFSEGHWAMVIRTGRITAILRRLAQLR